MRQKLFLLMLVTAVMPMLAQTATLRGLVVNASSGAPITGATVTLRDNGKAATTGLNGDFELKNLNPITDYLTISADGFFSDGIEVKLIPGENSIPSVRLKVDNFADDFYGDASDIIYDQAMLDDDEGSSQGIAALSGASDNIYYNTASYNFGPMYFRYRGLDSQYQSVYINGIKMNDPIRGRFNFSSLLGMTSRAFRNRTTNAGLEAASYGYGDIAGSVNYNTITDTYAPGFNGSAAFTNSNYMFRAMAAYSTGISPSGWCFTVNAIGRYAKEGVVKGTFYNSAGAFFSLEKIFDDNNSLTLTAFGGPTQRATASATYQEVYDLVGDNLYNPDWGWYDGKKRASKITETFDPTAMLTWLFKKGSTTLNTSAAIRFVSYSRSALQYYKANDPNPTYYRYLPSYFEDNEQEYEMYTNLWKHDESFRQINWDRLYRINELNNVQNASLPESEKKGSSYIMENRVNKQVNAMFSSNINTRLNSFMTLQGGLAFNYTKNSNYKTIRDLMGGEFWLDIDPFSDRDITIAPDNLQNDLDNPNRKVYKGDKFGYNYDIHYLDASAWIQNIINLRKWDINYGMTLSYTQFQREGYMRNGRAPKNSLGKGEMLRFDNASFKAGATYKVDGRNFFTAHAEYGTRAPLADQVYLAPRVKNTTIANPESERIISGDLSYTWNYRKFRGSISAFYTQTDNGIERTGFYDERYNTYANYVLSGVKKVYQGFELGMAYKITPSITATFAGTIAKFQYKNNPKGTRTFENGLYPDTTQTVYLKNYYLGSQPNTQCNVGLDWAAPKNWFFNINGTFQGKAYVTLSPAYHEVLPDLWTLYPDKEQLEQKVAELAYQSKLKNAFTLNLSVGKLIYINRSVSLNLNLNINNLLNNRDVVTYAYQQGRIDTKNYNRNAYPNRYSYAQGIKVFFNAGIRF